MDQHAKNTQNSGVAIYFCDLPSLWQRGRNENINGLLRHYLPKGTVISGYSQEEPDAIAFEFNMRFRKHFDFKSPIEMMSELMPIITSHLPPLARAYVIRPPRQHSARKVREFTELLNENFEQAPQRWGKSGP